jgi:predicted negative regulator of RcsB-dependent stress response
VAIGNSRLYEPGPICFGARFPPLMSTPAQPTPPSAGDDRHPATVDQTSLEPGFEARLTEFWARNRGLILAAFLLVALIIAGRSGWEWLQQRRLQQQAAAYAAASSEAQLKAFAAEHSGSALAGVAHLRVADEAYADRRYAEALTSYQQARRSLDQTPLLGRVRLGIAMTTLKQGDTAAGKNALQDLANDVGVAKPLRAEAAYHLASLALEVGDSAEVTRWVELISAIEPTGMWAQRAMMLRASAPAAAPASSAEEPAISFPGATR